MTTQNSTVTYDSKTTGTGFQSPKWALYNDLISMIPDDLVVEDVSLGIHWTMVRSIGVGLAMTQPGHRSIPNAGKFTGRKLRELVAYIKSWHPHEAALGVAAINSYFNAPSIVGVNWNVNPVTQPNESVFGVMKEALTGKKVTVVGHFPDLDQLKDVCDLSILERNPQEGDFPDPACEYILEDQDFLFMTGVTLINKTLPRLIELGRNAQIVLVGPSVPLTPFWFSKGVASLAGTTIIESDKIWHHVAQGGDKSIFKEGAHMVKLYPKDVRSKT
jgi:uncharacterized protein (DUF4213/DUF364 family)